MVASLTRASASRPFGFGGLGLIITALGLSFIPSRSAGGQVVTGQVIALGGAGPIRDGVAMLVDSANLTVGRSFTDDSGGFRLPAPRAGRYRVRVLRIGFRPTESPLMTLGVGETRRLAMTAEVIPLRLARIDVTARRTQCRAAADTALAEFTIWEAARSALNAAAATTDIGVEARIAVFDRVVDDAGRVTRRQVRLERGRARRPFGALSARDLDATGYVVPDSAGTLRYYAPDAEVLLSPEFADNHCFRAVAPTASDSATLVGVAFEPAQTRPAHVDIAGVLWVDRESAALRAVDVRYAGLDSRLSDAGAGARLEFARVPESPYWLVSSWVIRMPLLRLERNDYSVTLGRVRMTPRGESARQPISIRENGGEILELAAGDRTVWKSRLPALSGEVVGRDGAPLAGVEVSLRDADYRARTDSAGAFRIAGVLPGEYELALGSPLLDSLGLGSVPAGRVSVPQAGPTLRVGMPSRETVVTGLCGRRALEKGGALLRGIVRGADGSLLGPGRRIIVRWTRAVSIDQRVVAENGARELRTSSDGAFNVCGVPRGVALSISVIGPERTFVPPKTRIGDDDVVAIVPIRLPP